jgi:hypothetical protein
MTALQTALCVVVPFVDDVIGKVQLEFLFQQGYALCSGCAVTNGGPILRKQ